MLLYCIDFTGTSCIFSFLFYLFPFCPDAFGSDWCAALLGAHLVRDATSCIMFLVALKQCLRWLILGETHLLHHLQEILQCPLLSQMVHLHQLWRPACATNTTRLKAVSFGINAISPMVSGSLGSQHFHPIMKIIVAWDQAGWLAGLSHPHLALLQQLVLEPLPLLKSVLMLHWLEPSLGKVGWTQSKSVAWLGPNYP